ncbi:cryptochrome/photolyase family protein [Hydrogenophilus thiooxidans]|uniref:cryptochrome/photolyase family protein n=1 Tax=Hydrogenophilus thiooxidans TaxID=2820326 RepID=UPI001C24226E|nr:deoxyribodipyrimidine photo-lyase [Hydrogenophilus thiooxidans]
MIAFASENAPVALHWFRSDLRLRDNPALTEAARFGAVVPVWIDDTTIPPNEAPGAAYRWWTRRSLVALDDALKGNLRFFRGDPSVLLPDLVRRYGVRRVTWTEAYEPCVRARDTLLATSLTELGVEVVRRNGSLLWDPETIAKPDGTPYRVFTPFFQKGCLAAPSPRTPLPAPDLTLVPRAASEPGVEPAPEAEWERKLGTQWTIGEAAAHTRLDAFLANGLAGYASGRDFPARPHTSRLSPYLAHGEISPNTLWYAVAGRASARDVAKFRAELAWREFAHYLLVHFPQMVTEPFRPEFTAFPWEEDEALCRRWQRGETGIPIVDAAMRALWRTGYLHNRLRMVVASFLTKNLLLHWRVGEAWFRDTLVDYTLASNVASWQWVAGCGADAAPYFRIFNPVLQAEKFDPDGSFIATYLPELAKLPTPARFAPWTASEATREAAGLFLGKNYPQPIVSLVASRARALAAYARIKASTSD